MVARLLVLTIGLGASVIGSVVPAPAQSLGEIARQEEARRKQIKEPSKVYTNKDLAPVPPASSPHGGTPASAPAAEATRADAGGGTRAPGEGAQGARDAKDGAPAKGQAYWAGRKKELLAQLERDQTLAAAMQTRVNALTADFTARDDPAQRDAIGRDRQRALEELERLQKAIQSDQKAIADFEDEARRAAVPPGWLR